MFTYYSELHKCKLFFNDNLILTPLPCLFSDSLNQHLQTYHLAHSNKLVATPIEEATANYILNRLEQFLFWVEAYSKESKYVSLNNHHNLPNELLNHYINDVVIKQRELGEASAKQSINALMAYYNYLYQAGLTDNIKHLLIKPKFREQARNNTKSRTSIKYLTPSLRNTLYHNATTIRDELLLKTGGECGLRSKENQGFLLNDFKIGNKTHKGILSLFNDMINNQEQIEFQYYLQGLFTKANRHSGGISRIIFLHRELLRRFKEYYDTERPQSDSNYFFLNNSKSGNTQPIAPSCATQAFKKVRDKVIHLQDLKELPPHDQCLELGHTHHTLRHSFATDKFYNLAMSNNMAIDDVTTTSQVYLTVAALMGHSVTGINAPMTTRRYIRACHHKENFERMWDCII